MSFGDVMFDIINNTSRLLGDDLKKELTDGSKVRIAASCFSIYAYAALKDELERIDGLKFLFTMPAFVDEQISDKVKKEQKEFYIPKELCGTDFEIRLKNQMTQRAIARECADWLRNKVQIKTLKDPVATQSMINIERGGEFVHYTPNVIAAIQTAICNKRVISIQYPASGGQEPESRMIEPISLGFYEQNWYLIGFAG